MDTSLINSAFVPCLFLIFPFPQLILGICEPWAVQSLNPSRCTPEVLLIPPH